MSLLLLGGTADARRMAAKLHDRHIDVIYSVAGLVRQPVLECRVVSGGFSQFGGLSRYIKQQQVTAILDATHPYAATMSGTALKEAKANNIPCWRFTRLPWQVEKGDNWLKFDDWLTMLPALTKKSSILLTAGQVKACYLNLLLNHQVILRTAVQPTYELPNNVKWIKAIGPFGITEERRLLRQYKVDVMVSKNSGGEAVIAKIQAARELNVPVFMLTRPEIKAVDKNFDDIEACLAYVLSQYPSEMNNK